MTDRGTTPAATPTRPAGPVRLTDRSRVALRPATGGVITGGLWAERRRANREVSLPSGWDRLHEAGNFANLELAAGLGTGSYVNDLPFLDSDLYKWLEALGWTLGDPDLNEQGEARLQEFLETSHKLLAQAQEDDGYLDSHFQVRFPGGRSQRRGWAHELYCAAHLIRGAVPLTRTRANGRRREVARRYADL